MKIKRFKGFNTPLSEFTYNSSCVDNKFYHFAGFHRYFVSQLVHNPIYIVKNLCTLILLIYTCLCFGQVKIGDDINTIDASSLLELESSTKALVLTRVSNAEMNTITPLNGALVYNTDTNCVFYYNGSTWINLCDTTNTGGMLTDNLDGTYTFASSNGIQTTFREDDDITGVSFDGTDLTVEEGVTSFSADLSALEESADIAAEEARALAAEAVNTADITTNANAIAAHNAADGDIDATNELSDVALTGTILNLTNPEATATGVDLDATFATDAELAAAADDDISGATYDDPSTTLTITEGTTSQTVDLAALEESGEITAERTRALAAENAIQTDVDQNETDADNAIAANTADITTNANAIAAHNAADGDIDATNELSDVALTGTILNLTNPEATATGVDLDATFATDAELSDAIAASEALDFDKDASNGRGPERNGCR